MSKDAHFVSYEDIGRSLPFRYIKKKRQLNRGNVSAHDDEEKDSEESEEDVVDQPDNQQGRHMQTYPLCVTVQNTGWCLTIITIAITKQLLS